MKFTKKQKKIAIVVAVLVLVYIYYNPKKSVGGSYTIYGSESCPWTVKALEFGRANGHDFEFVDCKAGKCPSFVNGFPTYKNHTSGNIKSGYNENPHAI